MINLCDLMCIVCSTSSTAQGGGGNLWEVGCCESRMAERTHWWTERWLRSPLFLSLFLSLSLSFSLSFSHFLSLSLIIYQPTCRSINVWSWQRQKRSNSARHPQFLNLTTSETKQFCDTSTFFQVDNIKNEAILRDFVQKWKVECRADGLVPMSFAIFPVHLSKLLHLPRKSDARSYELLHLSRKIISANLKSHAPKCNLSQEISARTS